MARQNLRDGLIRDGLKVLKRQGLAVEEPSAGLIVPLKEQFGRDRATDLAVVHVLGRIADPAAAAALAQVATRAVSKEVKREVRRSLFNLSRKGVAVPEQEAEPRDTSKPNFSLTPDIEAYLSLGDGVGNYLLILARPQVGGGLFVIQAAINDRQGLQRIGGAVLRRKEFRETMNEMKAEHGISMVSIPWRYGDWRLHEAYEQGKARSAEGIEEYGRLRGHLTTGAVREEPHPVLSQLDRQQTIESVGLEATRKLLEEDEFRIWMLEEDLLLPYVERARDLKESRIVLNSVQQSQRFEDLVKEAVQGIFLNDALRPVFICRFEDAALHMARSGRVDKASAVFRVALALERQEVGGLLGIPLLEDLVRRSLALYLRQEEQEKQAEPSLIIKP